MRPDDFSIIKLKPEPSAGTRNRIIAGVINLLGAWMGAGIFASAVGLGLRVGLGL